MKLTYQVEVDVEPGENFNPLDLMNNMASAVDVMLPESTDGTVIWSITFGLTSMKGELPTLAKKQQEKERKAGPRVRVYYEKSDRLWCAENEDKKGYYGFGETRKIALENLYRYYPETRNMIVARKAK